MKNIATALIILVTIIGCSKEKSNITEQKTADSGPILPLDSVKAIADQTKKLLVTNLTQKISDSGTVGALEFCNVEALPLTKSVAAKHGLEVKRVSDRNRNPENTASSEELKIIENYRKQLLEKKALQGEIHGDYYYSPLVTNAICLQCHGVPGKTMKSEVSAKLAELYPEDKATGYSENELRGLLRIQMR